jgi:hypothetical protein
MRVSGQRHAPAALYSQEKDSRFAFYRRLGGIQSRSGHRGSRKNLLPLPWIESLSPGRPARSQTLYWLSYPLTLYLAVDIFMCSNNVATVKRKCCALWCEDGCHKVRVFVDAPGWWDAVPARGYFRYASTVKFVSAFGQSSLEPPVYINN